MGQFILGLDLFKRIDKVDIWIESDLDGIAKMTYLPKSD